MKKISIIFSLVLLFLFAFTLSCFASSYPDIDTYDIPYDYYSYAIMDYNGTYYALVLASNEKQAIDEAKFLYHPSYKCIMYSTGSIEVQAFHLKLSNVWDDYKNITTGTNSQYEFRTFNTIYESNVDIINKDDGTIFFQKAPVMEQELTMAQILEQNNPVQTFSSLMKNVLVSLVVFLVGLVAFFKAWTWLKTLLRQA